MAEWIKPKGRKALGSIISSTVWFVPWRTAKTVHGNEAIVQSTKTPTSGFLKDVKDHVKAPADAKLPLSELHYTRINSALFLGDAPWVIRNQKLCARLDPRLPPKFFFPLGIHPSQGVFGSVTMYAEYFRILIQAQ